MLCHMLDYLAHVGEHGAADAAPRGTSALQRCDELEDLEAVGELPGGPSSCEEVDVSVVGSPAACVTPSGRPTTVMVTGKPSGMARTS